MTVLKAEKWTRVTWIHIRRWPQIDKPYRQNNLLNYLEKA